MDQITTTKGPPLSTARKDLLNVDVRNNWITWLVMDNSSLNSFNLSSNSSLLSFSLNPFTFNPLALVTNVSSGGVREMGKVECNPKFQLAHRKGDEHDEERKGDKHEEQKKK